MAAVGLDWRPGVRKVAVVAGEALAKDPEAVSDFTAASVAAAAYAVDPVEVLGIDTAGLGDGGFSELVEASGGTLFTAGSASDIPWLVVPSVTTALAKPFAWIQGPYVDQVDATLEFDARALFAVKGTLTQYERDLDSDGTYDRTTTGPVTKETYTKPSTAS